MKKAIVTGGSGLIGKHICKTLSDKGWEVASFDTESSDSQNHFQCDIGNENAVLSAFKELGWDSIDLLVNNAARTPDFSQSFKDMPLKDWNEFIQSNLTGTFLMSREAAKRMNENANIINIASTRAFMSEPGDFAYAATKGGIISLTHAMAVELGPDIRVNAIAPGWITDEKDLRDIDHNQHPVGRVGRPKDISDAILYLIDASFVTGETITIDGGMTKKMIYVE